MTDNINQPRTPDGTTGSPVTPAQMPLRQGLMRFWDKQAGLVWKCLLGTLLGVFMFGLSYGQFTSRWNTAAKLAIKNQADLAELKEDLIEARIWRVEHDARREGEKQGQQNARPKREKN